jgi:hypothetical protein
MHTGSTHAGIHRAAGLPPHLRGGVQIVRMEVGQVLKLVRKEPPRALVLLQRLPDAKNMSNNVSCSVLAPFLGTMLSAFTANK